MPDRKALAVFPRRVGLFSLFLQVIGQIVLCRKAGIVPVVYFNSRCLYWSDCGHHGARNVWEYYFEPVSECAITDLVEADRAELERADVWEFSRRQVEVGTPRTVDEERVGRIRVREGAVVSNVFPVGVIDYLWEMSARRKRILYRVIQDSIRVRPHVADKAARLRAERFRGHVLGVHIRGRERARERLYFAADGLVPLECYVREIDVYLAGHPSSPIFCATDSGDALHILEGRYGSRLVYYPATRLSPADDTSDSTMRIPDDTTGPASAKTSSSSASCCPGATICCTASRTCRSRRGSWSLRSVTSICTGSTVTPGQSCAPRTCATWLAGSSSASTACSGPGGAFRCDT